MSRACDLAWIILVAGAILVPPAGMTHFASADSIETQSNPVSDGAITITPGDPDRSDWEFIPWYEADTEDAGLGVDPYAVQIAHDSTDVYVHIQLNQFDIEPGQEWRIQLWVDSDQNLDTGYLSNFAIGADSLLEVNTLYDYSGTAPGEWVWTIAVTDLPRDQTDLLDVAVQFPRAAINDTRAFDFFVMGQNFPDGQLEDPLPDFADQDFGDYFTYELNDLGPRLQAGDSNQDLKFDQLDLVQVQIAAKYLTGQPATWGEGDWNAAPGGEVGKPPLGDGRFDQLDIVAALGPGHYLTGPYAGLAAASQASVPVPEPSTAALLTLGLLAFAASGLRKVQSMANCSKSRPCLLRWPKPDRGA